MSVKKIAQKPMFKAFSMLFYIKFALQRYQIIMSMCHLIPGQTLIQPDYMWISDRKLLDDLFSDNTTADDFFEQADSIKGNTSSDLQLIDSCSVDEFLNEIISARDMVTPAVLRLSRHRSLKATDHLKAVSL